MLNYLVEMVLMQLQILFLFRTHIILERKKKRYFRAFNFISSNSIQFNFVLILKYFKETAPPIQPKLSEMKDNYLVNYATHEENLVRPPEPYAKCLIKALGRDEQPPIRIDVKGYYRWLDPYLTTNRSTYINFSDDDRRGIGEKNILTFYVVSLVFLGIYIICFTVIR